MEIGATRPRGAWIAIIETGVCWKGIVCTMAVSVRSVFVASCNHTGLLKAAILAFLFVLPLLGTPAAAQTTTISGTVYDARTTASSLPLPGVLVYVTTGTVAPLPSGVQCLTTSTPTGVVSYTYTAVDGTFTLGDVPVNASYTLVIQAGKWRRQFIETVAAVPLAGLALHMPADHTQGDIPKIAIATGSVDALECVFLDMGISQSEFTDDNDTTSGGRIHLYKGDNSPGANINASTPSETVLMGTPTDSSLLDSYDVVMFPCQGNAYVQSTTKLTNLLNYANAGGRVFTTHFSFDRLDPAKPYYSLFPPVANWDINQADPTPDPGVATVNTSFTDGATLAQWLQNVGATTTYGQVTLNTLRHDFNGVIPPTQTWMTLNNTAAGNPVMQFTFNTPVGAPAASQCGRVLYNEYHVFSASSSGKHFPAECPTSTTVTAQMEMLNFAMFDLSTFVTPVVVPDLSIAINPSPLIVKQGDSADQATINVTNASSTVEIYSSVVLTLTLPPGLTATALTDATGGWICTLGTLTCTRTTSIAASASDSVTLTVSVPAYTTGSSTQGTITAVASSPNFSNNVTQTDTVIFQQQPAITWAAPASILYGTPLSATQLDATSPILGSFSYSPSAGTVLPIGKNTLTATLSPTDTTDYTTSKASVSLTVIPATPLVSLTSSADPVFTSNPVTFTATLIVPAGAPASPTGTVTFFDGTTQLGSGAVTASVATFATTALATGIHSITAVYSGDTNYTTANSLILSEIIQDFTIALSPGAAGTVTAPLGGQADYSLVITPVGGTTLPSAVNLTLTGLPPGMTAAFSTDVVAAGSSTANVTLQVFMPGYSALQPSPGPFGGRSLPVALGLILLPFAGRLRKTAHRFRMLAVLALAGAALATGLTGCQTTFTPKTFPLTVTATSGNLSHKTTVNIIVQ
jgi:hypothetical protein